MLGIEVDHYLRKLIQQSRSPLLTPWGGVSQALFRILDHDLQQFSAHKIRAFFVFTGLTVQHPDADTDGPRQAARFGALQNLERKKNDETISTFASLAFPSELTSALMAFLKRRNLSFIVAPYQPGAQLAYMLEEGHIDAIFSAAESLIFGAERVITELNFTPVPRITFCDKSFILKSQLSGLTDDQFLDAYLFAGNDICGLVPILEQNPPSEYSSFRIRAAADVVSQNGSGYLALNGNPLLDKRPQYMEDWLRGRALMKFHPFLDMHGNVNLRNAKEAPNDLARVLGPRLPRELYFYISRGVIALPLINALISGFLREAMPLDGGESRDYRSALDALHDVEVQSFDLLHGSKQLHNYHEKRSITTRRWYSRSQKDNIEKLEQPLIEGLGQPNHLLKLWYPVSTLAITDREALLALLGHENWRASSIGHSHMHHTSAALRVWSHVLQLRGYLTASQKPTEWGKTLLAALDVTHSSSVSVLVAVEMLKLQSIKFEAYSTKPPTKSGNTESSSAIWTPIARLGALLPLRQNDAPWQGPVDRDALIALSIVQAFRSKLSGLADMVALLLLLRKTEKSFEKEFDSYGAVGVSLKGDNDSGLVIYAKHFFELAASDMTGSKDYDDVFASLQTKFPTVTNGREDLQNLLQLWRALAQAAKFATKLNLMGAMEAQKFDKTSSWLEQSISL